MKLSDKITNLRKENNMTQEDLAVKVGVSRQSVSKWEAGGAQPDLDKILALSKIFGVTTDYLIDETMDDYRKSDTSQSDKSAFADDFIYQFVKREEDKSIYVGIGIFLLIISAIGYISGSNYGWLAGIILAIIGLGLVVYAFINRDRVYNLEESSYFNFANNISSFRPVFKRNILIAISVFALAAILYKTRENYDLYYVTESSLGLFLLACATSLTLYSIIRRNAYKRVLDYIDDDENIKSGWTSTASSNYRMIVTAIYLLYSFYSFDWHISWIIWVIAPIGENILESIFD